jgi:thymidylate synthase
MRQYLNLLKAIKENGTWKEPAREGMPKTLSLFGYQMRFNLQDGFPLVTTKSVSFKNIIVELLWFLKGNTNTKFLIDNGCNVWNEDTYNYYLKKCKEQNLDRTISFDLFCSYIKNSKSLEELQNDSYRNSLNESNLIPKNYCLGDCGKQYGWLWRSFGAEYIEDWEGDCIKNFKGVDQLKELIEGLKSNPMSRRHIISAWNPATLDEMALNACHSFVQFNCRPLSNQDRYDLITQKVSDNYWSGNVMSDDEYNTFLDEYNIPKYYLDCKFTMRSNDAVLGNCYNVASYALLTHIIAKICNMEVGNLIADLGDVHIYENHLPAVGEQLQREPRELPKLKFSEDINWDKDIDDLLVNELGSDDGTYISKIILENYNPHPKLDNETKLFTGLK